MISAAKPPTMPMKTVARDHKYQARRVEHVGADPVDQPSAWQLQGHVQVQPKAESNSPCSAGLRLNSWAIDGTAMERLARSM